jgi:superfamily II DNA or RNA helicase
MVARFLRSKRLRGVLYRAADGKCQACGDELPIEWHADHVVPYAMTQRTNIHEMQALCPQCNLKKGKKMPIVLREWQERASRMCDRATTDFFIEATPGAGKTKLGCHIAKGKIDCGEASQVIVVVPTTTLKEQWADSMHQFDIDTEPEYKGGKWPSDFNAICATYQQVANDPAMFGYITSRSGTVVVLDEIHHCGDDANWGAAIKSAFGDAAFRLALSGTPFRSDNEKIPFLRYVDGKAQPDVVYGYGDGLRDNICRHIFFPRQGGVMEWSSPQGKIKKHTFDDSLAESEASQRLRTALTTGEWLSQTLKDATEKLSELRKDDDDAAGLVIAIDQQHAKRICRIFASNFAIEPVCVSSDDPDSHAKIEQFKKSKSPWIVAVKMVSEGVDIPRLRVGVYATMVKTEMFFRQAIGRFVRVEDQHDDPTAVVYIPDDPDLRAFAEEIRQQRIHQLEVELAEEKKRDRNMNEMEGHDASLFMPLSSEAECKGTIYDEFTFTPEELSRAAELSMGQCKPEVAAAILRRAMAGVPPVAESVQAKKPRKSDDRKRFREINAKLVGSIAYATGREHSHINKELNDIVGIRKIADASIAQLQRRIEAAEQMAMMVGVPRV